MITIYGEISEVPTSKAQQLEACAEIQNEINQLEIKKLILLSSLCMNLKIDSKVNKKFRVLGVK